MFWFKTFYVLLVVHLFNHIEASLSCNDCLGGRTLICPNYDGKQYELSYLTPVDGVIDSLLRIECNRIPTVNYTLLSGCSFPEVKSILFRYCPFNETLASTLSQIPGIRLEKIENLEIYIPFPSISHLTAELFKGLTNLRTLKIKKAEFEKIDEDAFKYIPKVHTLYLTENNLTDTLEKETFYPLKNLTKIVLVDNNITAITQNLFSNSSKLNEIQMGNNELTILPEGVFDNLESLKIISFIRNKLKYINENVFSKNKQLNKVNFKKNNLKTIPENLFVQCTNLTKVTFTQNSIQTIPTLLLQNNDKIEELEFGFNNINVLPKTIFQNLPLLTSAQFSSNNISHIDEELFSKNENLKEINLSYNMINNLPENIFATNLKLLELNLQNNILETLPENLLTKNVRLEKLNLGYNKLTNLSFNSFYLDEDSRLKYISLSHNQLTKKGIFLKPFHIFALNRQLKLEVIDLSFNKIREFPNGAGYYNYLDLREINLRGNLIKKLNTSLDLSEITDKVSIDLRDNAIERVYHSDLYDEKLLKLYLDGNNFTCDCQIYYFIKDVLQKSTMYRSVYEFDTNKEKKRNQTAVVQIKVLDANKLLCHKPNKFAGEKLLNINIKDLTCYIPPRHCGTDKCPCTYRSYSKIITVNCKNGNFTSIPEIKTWKNTMNYALNFSNNKIRPPITLSQNLSIVDLDLSHNELTSEDFENSIIELPPKLKLLRLNDNRFTRLSERFLKTLNASGTQVRLINNPWHCNCQIMSLVNFLRSQFDRVEDLQDLKCFNIIKSKQTPLIKITEENVCYTSATVVLIASLCVAAILIITAVMVTVCYYRHKIQLKVWLFSHQFCLWFVTEEEIDVDKEYDAFISFSHKDNDFVSSTLVPGLEKLSHKLCLHYRDWLVGELIQDQIANSVQNSRRTIVVLSENYLESEWGQMEFKQAHKQAMLDNTNRVIVILYGKMPEHASIDEDLKNYVSTRTYLKYDAKNFWPALHYAMPHKKPQKNGIKMNQINKQNSNKAENKINENGNIGPFKISKETIDNEEKIPNIKYVENGVKSGMNQSDNAVLA